jgi:hypothetical protein
LQLATIWSMAASFDLEIIENPPIERRNKSLAPALFLWIMWIDPGDQPRWARASHMAKVFVTLISELPMTIV